MKKITYIILSIFTATVLLNSCVKDTDYDTPQITCNFDEANHLGAEDTYQDLIDAWFVQNDINEDGIINPYDNESEDPYIFELFDPNLDDPNLRDYITGYVVSNDQTGNFYKELYLQDDPTNPTSTIKLGLNKRSLFAKYNLGRKVYVYLDGLALNRSHGEWMIGEMITGSLEEMNEATIIEKVIRNCEAVELTPKLVTSPSLVNDDLLGMFVQFDGVQFDLSLIGSTFVDPADDFDTHLPITSCEDGSVIMLETSTFADFKLQEIPEGSGSVTGILTRDYGDDFYVLRVNSPNDFTFDGERCDPETIDCDNPNAGTGVNTIFNEDFNAYTINETNIPGWTNVNVNSGSNLFEVREYSSEKYMQCSAYNSGENPLEVWLVTPAINMDSSIDEALTFKTKTGYNNGAALGVYLSTDFSGDVNTATWTMLDATLANGPSSGYGEFVDSGVVDISCVDGDVYIAFKYLGGDGGVTTTFQVDDVKVTGN